MIGVGEHCRTVAKISVGLKDAPRPNGPPPPRPHFSLAGSATSNLLAEKLAKLIHLQNAMRHTKSDCPKTVLPAKHNVKGVSRPVHAEPELLGWPSQL